MQIIHIAMSLIALALVGYVYGKFQEKEQLTEQERDNLIIEKYLIDDDSILREKRPLVWVYIPREINARNWLSFYSRNTRDLNQPYLMLTLHSIIRQVGDSARVCLIDDQSFMKIIPGWSIDLGTLADPVKTHMRTLALAKVLYNHGGVLVPISYLAMKPISELALPIHGGSESECFVVEGNCRMITSESLTTFPSHQFMGCLKESLVMREFIGYLEALNSKDFTSEQDILGQADRWLYQQSLSKKIQIIPACRVGITDKHGRLVGVEGLLNSSYVDYCPCLAGIWIPQQDILKRSKYSWFARLSHDQIYSSNIELGRRLLVSLN